jgi:hypothetical protein
MFLEKCRNILREILGYADDVMCFWRSSDIFIQGSSSLLITSTYAMKMCLPTLYFFHLLEKVFAACSLISRFRLAVFQFALNKKSIMGK